MLLDNNSALKSKYKYQYIVKNIIIPTIIF